jgi:hypothetical protein
MFTRAKKILASELMYALEKTEDEPSHTRSRAHAARTWPPTA